MFAQDTSIDNAPLLHDLAGELLTYVRTAASQGTPVHEVERGLWQRLLQRGYTTLSHFFDLQGSGDLGETVTLPDGQTHERLPELHRRRYVSLFGEFTRPVTPKLFFDNSEVLRQRPCPQSVQGPGAGGDNDLALEQHDRERRRPLLLREGCGFGAGNGCGAHETGSSVENHALPAARYPEQSTPERRLLSRAAPV